MTYANPFLKITWNFTISGTDEIAQTSLNFRTTDPLDDPADVVNDINSDVAAQAVILNAMGTLMGNAETRWADYSRLNSVRFAKVDVTALEPDPPVVFEDTSPSAGSNVGVIPPQSSIVVSTRSGLTTGVGNFGRMFLPHCMLALQANSPLATTAGVSAVAAAARIFINAVTTSINGITTSPVVPSIMSQAAFSLDKPIVQIAVGNVNDTQRRRRNQLSETYTFLPLP